MGRVQVLMVGLSENIKTDYLAKMPSVEAHACSDKAGIKTLVDRKEELNFKIVLCGDEFSGLDAPELAQTFRMLYPEARVLYVVNRPNGFDRKLFVKNGFDEVFLLPLDQQLFKNTFEKSISEAEEDLYTPVHLVDIGSGTQLDFELKIFLNRNNKYISYAGVGEVLDEPRLERLKNYKVAAVYIPIEQLQAFYDFSARRLSILNNPNSGIPEANRSEMMKNSVRQLLGGMLSESYAKNTRSGKKVLEHTKKILDQYLTIKHPGEWQQKLIAELGHTGEAYSHTSNVSSYAILFSMILKQADAKDLVVASHLHDLGLVQLPEKLQTARIETMTPEEQYMYKMHPDRSLKAINAKRMSVSDGVVYGVVQHHEKWDGTGFPQGLKGERISIEGQILAIANRFDQLTKSEGGQAPMSPDQALKMMESEGTANPEIIRQLSQMFEKEATQHTA